MAFTCNLKINGLDRLITQYRNSPNLTGYIEALLDQADVLCTALNTFDDFFDIDLAESDWLRLLALIIGPPGATLGQTDNNTVYWFGFGATNPVVRGYDRGKFWDSVGSQPTEVDVTHGVGLASDPVFTDAELRNLLKAKIIRNNTNCSIDDCVRVIQAATGVNDIEVADTVGSFTVTIHGAVSTDLLSLLQSSTLIPRPAGITLTSVTAV